MHSSYPFFPSFHLEIYSAGEVSLAVVFLASVISLKEFDLLHPSLTVSIL